MEIISKFMITYENGISQTKVLISKDTYNEIKNIMNEVTNLEGQIADLSKKNKKRVEIENRIKKMISPIKELNEYFVVDSPLYNAWNQSNREGILVLPKSQGGNHNIIIECLGFYRKLPWYGLVKLI